MAEVGKHSPGPWSFEAICFDQKIGIKGGVTAYGRPYTIAHVNRPGSAYAGQDKANAHLIAAAPDLLDALTFAKDVLQMMVRPGSIQKTDVMTAFTQAVAAETKARTAIAKALGLDEVSS